MSSRWCGALAAAWLLALSGLSAQAPRPPMADAVFKNVQIL
jgi:hypothetical protein